VVATGSRRGRLRQARWGKSPFEHMQARDCTTWPRPTLTTWHGRHQTSWTVINTRRMVTEGLNVASGQL